MPAQQRVFHGISISHEPRSDRFVAHHVLTPDQGRLLVMKRQSVKPNAASSLDLFDEGEFCVDAKTDSPTTFLKEFCLQNRRTSIAQNYSAFQLSTRFAKILLKNPVHEENAEAIFFLTQKALDSWAKTSNPEAVYLKSLYLYCRDEGYPINAEWYAQLPRENASLVKEVLNTPLDSIKADAASIKDSIHRLEIYLERSTHIETPW